MGAYGAPYAFERSHRELYLSGRCNRIDACPGRNSSEDSCLDVVRCKDKYYSPTIQTFGLKKHITKDNNPFPEDEVNTGISVVAGLGICDHKSYCFSNSISPE